MNIPYLYVDTPTSNDKYAGICVKVGDDVVSRQCSDCIKADARNTGIYLASIKATEWLNSSSIDNYLHDLSEDQGLDYENYPDYDLRELIQEGYAGATEKALEKKFNLVNLYNRSIKTKAVGNYIYQLYMAQRDGEISIPAESWAIISVRLTYLMGCDDWSFDQGLKAIEDFLNELGV